MIFDLESATVDFAQEVQDLLDDVLSTRPETDWEQRQLKVLRQGISRSSGRAQKPSQARFRCGTTVYT